MSAQNTTELQIQLTRSAVAASSLQWTEAHAFPLKVEAKSNINLENVAQTPDSTGWYPCNIFTLQLNGTGLDPNQGDRFVKVATAIDIDEIPSYLITVSNSTPTESILGYPYYRYHSIELFVDTPEYVEQLWTWIQDDVFQLVKDYNSLLTLVKDSSILVTATSKGTSIYSNGDLIIKGIDDQGDDTGLYSLGIKVNDNDSVEPYVNEVPAEDPSVHTYENDELTIQSTGAVTDPYKVGVFVEKENKETENE